MASRTGTAGPPDQPPASGLRLRPPRLDDEAAFRRAHEMMARESFTFGLGFEPDAAWGPYLTMLDDHRRGVNLAPGLVPATFLVADVSGTIVGRSSIRHELNDFLEREGGHIGYCVLPGHRRRGYATEILRQSLVIARAVGVQQALLVCDDGNTGSRAVIEGCGGRLASRGTSSSPEGQPIRRYLIG
jgi:predicted acetyltransferase